MLSICIIVKDEAENLNICLEKLSKTGYEIIVVDTGSTDNSKEIAYRYTTNVYDFHWCNDFSAARNFAISRSKTEFIMMVDSDEFLTNIDKKQFETLLSQHKTEVGRIFRNNIYTRNGVGFSSKELVNRVFSKNLYNYKGKIHEQVVSKNNSEYKTYPVPIYFDHSGYEGNLEIRRKKSERNIRLLEQSLIEDGEDPYIYYQLGKGYYLKEDYILASENLGKALEFDLNTELEYVQDMVEMYGYSLINTKQNEKALFFQNIYDIFSRSADFVFLMGYIYMQNAMFDHAIQEFLKATEYKECKVEGVNSTLAFYNVGVIYECLGEREKAIEFYEKTKDYPLAMQGLERIR